MHDLAAVRGTRHPGRTGDVYAGSFGFLVASIYLTKAGKRGLLGKERYVFIAEKTGDGVMIRYCNWEPLSKTL
jgi:hypothetical protein